MMDLSQAKEVLKQFKKPKTDEEIFYNICFCICVPQTKFSIVLIAIEYLKQKDFYTRKLLVEEVQECISQVRYKNRKSTYLFELKQSLENSDVIEVVRSVASDVVKRRWLVGNIKGLGWKATSHLLRNLGAEDLAIIDTHILKYLAVKDKKWKYLEVESKMRKIAQAKKISVALLDAMIWKQYSRTSWENFIY